MNFIDKSSKVALHFKTQHVDVKIDNCLAVMSITQVFVNETDQSIEATYMFPIETELKSTVITNVNFKLGGKEVSSKVVLKEIAKEKYEDAIAGGKAAMIVEESENSKDILKMTVGGIQSHQEV